MNHGKFIMLIKNIFLSTIISVMLILGITSTAFPQDINESEELNIEVGLISYIKDDNTISKVSVTIEYLVTHYLKESGKNIFPVSLTENYYETLSDYDNNPKEFYNLILDKIDLHALIIIESSYSFNSLLSNILILRKDENNNVKEVYKEVFKIDISKLENNIPPEKIIQEIPRIVTSILSVNIYIKTNLPEVEIYFNDVFITYARPSIIITANMGIYDIKISAKGYIPYEETITLTTDVQINIELQEKLIETKGLSIIGMLTVYEEMFADNNEVMGLSALYSFSYYFPLFNINKFVLDFNLLILNVKRQNTAYFYYDTQNTYPDDNGSEFISEIPFNSISFFFNFLYEPVFKIFPYVNPIMGLGIGYSITDIDDYNYNYNPETSVNSFSSFSYNIIAGLSINIDIRYSIILEYRYLWLGNIIYWELLEFYIPQQDNLLNKIEYYYQGSVVLIGLRINI